jgi:hypothetical protein
MEHTTFEEIRAQVIKILKDLWIGGTKVTATAAEINKLAGGTLTKAEMNALHGLDPTYTSQMFTKEVDFTETAGAGTYTAAITVPVGALVHDVRFTNTAVWTATTSATLNVGDAGDADGIFAAVDAKTSPTAGAFLSYARKDTGVGAYAGTKELAYAAGGTITGTVVTVGAAGSAGRSKLEVIYSVPVPTAATKA